MNFRGMHNGFAVILFSLTLAQSASAKTSLGTPDPSQYKEALAQKLNKVNVDLDVREGSFSGYKNGVTNEDDLNPKMSTTTYHSYNWDYCTKWAGQRNCADWMPAYISPHGEHEADRSPLEGLIFSQFQQSKGQQSATEYALWDIKARGSYLKADRTLDREAITSWKVKKPIVNKIDDIGYRTASQAIFRTYENSDKQNPYVMPNMESLRRMSGSFSKMLRNRFVAGIGQIRASQPGIEFGLGASEIATCRQYITEMRRNGDSTRAEERLKPQNNLAIETRVLNRRIDDRAKLCEQMMNTSAYAVNPKVNGRQIRAGGPDREYADAALYRANLVAMDFTGADPREKVALDSRLEFDDDTLKSNITQYDNGGLQSKTVKMTNSQQLKLYKKSLAVAGNAIDRAASRSTGIESNDGQAEQYAIEPESMATTMINDITPDMRNDLKDTGYKQARQPASQSNEPSNKLEMKAAQLVVTQVQ